MKTLKYIIATLSLIFSINAFAETRYVSENIFIYLHSGPSTNYRIIGTAKTGAPLTLLNYNDETKFMQVKTAKGKVGWVKANELQKELPAIIELPKVQKQLQEAQAKLNDIANENDIILQANLQSITEKEKLIGKLQSEKQSLQETIETLKAKNLELDLLQDTKDERVKMEWMMYGGSVLFFGILVGLMIPFLPRRKKRRDNW